MIDEIDRRLRNWAEYRLSGGTVVGGVRCALASIGSGGRGTATEIYWPDEVLDTDGAVARIDQDLQRVVQLQYLYLELRPDQRARKARVCLKTFYNRLHTAHQHVLYNLSPKKAAVRGNQVRDRILSTVKKEA